MKIRMLRKISVYLNILSAHVSQILVEHSP